MDFSATTLRDNAGQGRFELVDAAGRVLGSMDYRTDGPVRSITHTEVPDALQDQGVGSHLADQVLQHLEKPGAEGKPRLRVSGRAYCPPPAVGRVGGKPLKGPFSRKTP